MFVLESFSEVVVARKSFLTRMKLKHSSTHSFILPLITQLFAKVLQVSRECETCDRMAIHASGSLTPGCAGPAPLKPNSTYWQIQAWLHAKLV